MKKLVDAGLVTVEPSGRHRYYRLSNPAVGDAAESLLVLNPFQIPASTVSRAPSELAAGRTCYDHLAGKIGVSIAQSLVQRGWVEVAERDFVVTGAGISDLLLIGVDVEETVRPRRAFARRCLDWSERRYHIGGSLGAAIADAMFNHRWIRRRPSSRAIKVTEEGRRALKESLDFDPA